jgi:very-short-patch-repair endonuclease
VGRKTNIDGQISEAATLRGLITHGTLREIGLSRQAIGARCRAHVLIPVHRGVYFVGHAERTPIASAEAAVIACGPRSVLSHDSAAALWGLRRWPSVPEISSALQHKRPGIRTHQTRTLTRADVTTRHAIRVTTVARTLADIAPRLTDIELERAIHEARRNRDLPNAQLTRLYDLRPRAARVFDSTEAPSRSVFQHRLKAFVRARRIPAPEFEAPWHGYEVDAFYEDHGLIIELDGYRDHSEPDRFEADRLRDALALELGFVTLRITWKRLTREPDELARQLRAILAARAPNADPRAPNPAS